MDLFLPPPNRGSGEPAAASESFLESVLLGISQELSTTTANPGADVPTPLVNHSNFNFHVSSPSSSCRSSPRAEKSGVRAGSSPALLRMKDSPRSGNVFRRKFSIPVPLLSLKGRLFRKRISEASGCLIITGIKQFVFTDTKLFLFGFFSNGSSSQKSVTL